MKKKLNKALWARIKELGSELELSKKSGLTQANVNKIKNNHVAVENIKLGTLMKLFPNIQINFLGKEEPDDYINQILSFVNNLNLDEQKRALNILKATFEE